MPQAHATIFFELVAAIHMRLEMPRNPSIRNVQERQAVIGRRQPRRLFVACGVPKVCRAGRNGGPWQLGGLAGSTAGGPGCVGQPPWSMSQASLICVLGSKNPFCLARLAWRGPCWCWYRIRNFVASARVPIYIQRTASCNR